MKQIVQNYKQGSLLIEEVPEPALKAGGVLVQTYHSLISAGTEKMKVDDSKRSYIGMAKARPEKVKQVMETFKQQGPLATYRKVMNRLDSYTPLGYSLAGKVIAVGKGVSDFKIGDLVACAGADIANHAEINWIPVNLCCKLPKVENGSGGYLPTEQAAFATVGAIAMQGVRQAGVQIGENVVVIGLGLVGLLSCLILKAAGCRVMGMDIDPEKVKLGLKTGLDAAVVPTETDVESAALAFSDGVGADAVMLTTGTSSNEPIVTAGKIARDRATIVDVGINKMDVPWHLYYEKELVLKQSRSYGPGRYDPGYEMNGQDYPIGYVRWTENRNMASFLRLMASGKIDIRPLITHRFKFHDAQSAYDLLNKDKGQLYVGMVLEYVEYDGAEGNLISGRKKTIGPTDLPAFDGMSIGMIGAGNFARTMLLPYLKGDNVRLGGIATATGISAKDTARKFGFSFCSTDYKALLANNEINTILVATRHNLHGRLALEALDAGKHVFTEKPLCLNEDELNKIAGAMSEKNLILSVGFNRRYAPMIKEVKSFFTSRKDPMVMHYRVNAGFKDKTDWYQDPYVGGGRIIGEVCHFIDTFQFLTDSSPTTVFAQSIQTENTALTIEDNVVITIGFSDGSVGSISYIANGDPNFSKEYLEVFCENQVAVMDNFSKLTTMTGGKKKIKKSVVQDKGHNAEMKALIDTLTGKPASFLIDFNSIYATTLTTFKILESLRTGKMMHINQGYPSAPADRQPKDLH